MHQRANMDLQFICNPHGTAMYACMYSSKAEAPNSQVIQKQVLKMLAKEEAACLHEMTTKKCFAPRCLSLVQEKSPHKKLLSTSWGVPSFYVPGLFWRLMFCPLGVDKSCSIQFLKLSNRIRIPFLLLIQSQILCSKISCRSREVTLGFGEFLYATFQPPTRKLNDNKAVVTAQTSLNRSMVSGFRKRPHQN